MNDSAQPYSADQPWRDEPPAVHTPLPAIDQAAFSAELDALHARLKADLGADDIAHLRKMERWGRLCTLLGYATAWFPNPLAALLIAVGNVARWAIVSHHVIHKGYDQVPGVPARYRSSVYAQGWRRWLDWADWLYPPAWAHEHNRLHHYHTGQPEDPDLVERNAWIMRLRAVPRPFKWLPAGLLICTWKLVYYAPNTFWAWKQHEHIRAQSPDSTLRARLPTAANVWRLVAPGERLLLPVTWRGLQFYARCVLPHALWRFVMLPALFLPLGTEA
jgi:hypothetical protein